MGSPGLAGPVCLNATHHSRSDLLLTTAMGAARVPAARDDVVDVGRGSGAGYGFDFLVGHLGFDLGGLMGQLSNRQNISTITLLLKSDEATVPDGIQRATCGCGCGQPVVRGRKLQVR